MRLAICILLLGVAGAVRAADFAGKRDGATLYEMLGVSETGSDSELLEAYRAGARLLSHPTGPREPGFDTLLDVWGILGRPTLRKLYDGYLAERRKDGIKADGEYDRLLFHQYAQVLLADWGTSDPPSFDHAAAFPVFLKAYEDRLAPRTMAPGSTWASPGLGLCGKSLWRLAPLPLVAAGVAAFALHQHRSPIAPSANPPAPTAGGPLAPPPDPPESPAERAARKRGSEFTESPPTNHAPQK